MVLKIMSHELKQLVEEDLSEEIWIDKRGRLTLYTDMLITSFDVMRSGMSYEDYNIFRSTLAPASGFQSAQFRYLELYCTRLENLRSEEHTSELQSRGQLVCRLLLEKKKNVSMLKNNSLASK